MAVRTVTGYGQTAIVEMSVSPYFLEVVKRNPFPKRGEWVEFVSSSSGDRVLARCLGVSTAATHPEVVKAASYVALWKRELSSIRQ